MFVFLELVLVPDSAAGVLPGAARETEALPALAEDRGLRSSWSDSSEEEEEDDEEGGAATRRFLVDVLTGVEVSGPRAGLLPFLEGGAEVQSTVPLLAAGWELSGRALSGSSSQALGRLLAGRELVAGCDSSSSSSTASQMEAPGTGLCFLVMLSKTKSCMRLGVGSSLNFWFAGVRRALSANSCGFLIRVRGTSR